jgi:DNA mismatch endonuclease (patch repair protein)
MNCLGEGKIYCYPIFEWELVTRLLPMSDTFSKSERSQIMRSVGSEGTSAERRCEKLLRAAGICFQKNVGALSGRPDFVLLERNTVVFVHGCFWHGHKGCKQGTLPSSNQVYWKKKIEGNKRRDARVRRKLRKEGWRTAVFWECKLRNGESVSRRLARLAKPPGSRKKLR